MSNFTTLSVNLPMATQNVFGRLFEEFEQDAFIEAVEITSLVYTTLCNTPGSYLMLTEALQDENEPDLGDDLTLKPSADNYTPYCQFLNLHTVGWGRYIDREGTALKTEMPSSEAANKKLAELKRVLGLVSLDEAANFCLNFTNYLFDELDANPSMRLLAVVTPTNYVMPIDFSLYKAQV